MLAGYADVSQPLQSSILTDNTSVVSFPGNQIGYFWMLTNCVASAAYVLAMRKRIKTTGFSDWDSMFYNNLLCVPILAVSSFISEDWGTENLSRNFPADSRRFLFSAIALSGATAVGISYATVWCIRVTSSTTYSMVGALNKLPVAASGMVFFDDPVTPASISSIGVGFFAGLLYSVSKTKQKAKHIELVLPVQNQSPSFTSEHRMLRE